MGLSRKGVVSPEEGCSNKRKYREEDFMQVSQQEFPDPDFDVEEDDLYHDKLIAKLTKEHQKYIDAAKATWKKPNCQTNIDCPVATDMLPGDQPKKIRGKKKKKNDKV